MSEMGGEGRENPHFRLVTVIHSAPLVVCPSLVDSCVSLHLRKGGEEVAILSTYNNIGGYS